MDKYDPALIFDLAAGLLPADEARTAEAALSPEGQAELAAQRAVLAAISADEVPQMTDIERARLHRGVAAGMADATREMPAVAAAPVRSPSRPRSVIWMRVASAAAAAALVVGVVGVGSQLVSENGEDATADTVARNELSQEASGGSDMTTTTAAAAGADSEAMLGSDGDADESGGGLDSAEALPVEEQGLAMLEEAPRLEGAPAESDLGRLEDFAISMMETQRFNEDLSSLPCYEVAVEDDDLEIVTSFRAPYPGANDEELVAIAFSDAGTPTSDPLVRLYDPVTCEPLADSTATP